MIHGRYSLSSLVQHQTGNVLNTYQESSFLSVVQTSEEHTLNSTSRGNSTNLGGLIGSGTTSYSSEKHQVATERGQETLTVTSLSRHTFTLFREGSFGNDSAAYSSVVYTEIATQTDTLLRVGMKTQEGVNSYVSNDTLTSNNTISMGEGTLTNSSSALSGSSSGQTQTLTSNYTLNDFSVGSHALSKQGTFDNGSFSFGSVVYREQQRSEAHLQEHSVNSVQFEEANYNVLSGHHVGSFVIGFSAPVDTTSGETRNSHGDSLETATTEKYGNSSTSLYKAGSSANDIDSNVSLVNTAQSLTTWSTLVLRRDHSEGDYQTTHGRSATGTGSTSLGSTGFNSQQTLNTSQGSDGTFSRDVWRVTTASGLHSESLAQQGVLESSGLALSSVVYQAWSAAGTLALTNATMSSSGTVARSDSTALTGSQTGAGYAASGSGGGSGQQNGFSVQTELSALTLTTADASSLYQAGSFSFGNYAFASITLDKFSSEQLDALVTTLSQETGTALQSQTANPQSNQASGAGAGQVVAREAQGTLTQAASTYSNTATLVLSQHDRSLATLHEEGRYAAHSFSLSSFSYAEAVSNTVSLSQDTVRASTQTHQVGRTTAASSAEGTQDTDASSQGSANFTTTQTSLGTTSLRSEASFHGTRFAAGSASLGCSGLASFVHTLRSSGWQSSTLDSRATATSAGSNSGTMQLGLEDPFAGSGTFERGDVQTQWANDTRNYSIELYAAGTASNHQVSLSSYALHAASLECQAYWRSGVSVETLGGTANGSGSYTGLARDTFTEGDKRYLASTLDEEGTFEAAGMGQPGGFRLNTAMTLQGVSVATATKYSLETYGGAVSGHSRLTAVGGEADSFTLGAVGSYGNGSYSLSSFTLSGWGTHTFGQIEEGEFAGVTYSHGEYWEGVGKSFAQGSLSRAGGSDAYSLSSYSAVNGFVLELADEVGASYTGLVFTMIETTTGTGSVGTRVSVSSEYYARQGLVDELTETWSLSVPLTGAVPPPLPETRGQPTVVPALAAGGSANGGVRGVTPWGTAGAGLPLPSVGGLNVPELLGSAGDWVLQLGSDPQLMLPRLRLTLEVLGRPGGLPGLSNVQLGFGAAGPLALGGSSELLWSWLGMSGVVNEMLASIPYGATTGRVVQATRTRDPLGRASTAAWESRHGVDTRAYSHDLMWGLLDTVTMGFTRDLRQWSGSEWMVDERSEAYRIGGYAGQVVSILMLCNPCSVVSKAYFAAGIPGTQVRAAEALAEGRYGDAAFLTAGLVFRGLGAGGASSRVVRGGAVALGGVGLVRGVYQGVERFNQGDKVGGVLTLLEAAAGAYSMTQSCFTGETKLETPYGWTRIDGLTVGDLVLSRQEDDPEGAVETKAVEEVFQRTGPVWHLHAAGEVIRTSMEHPFYVAGKGWTEASQLKRGDLLAGRDGRWALVEEVYDTGEWETLYNVRVAEYHTYFVGDEGWGFSVWAHNAYTLNGKEAKYGPTYINKLGPNRVLPANAWTTILPGALNTKENRAAIRAWAKSQGVNVGTPNPGGRHGDPVTRRTATYLEREAGQSKTAKVTREEEFAVAPGRPSPKKNRYVDVMVEDGNKVTLFQIVRSNKNGTPHSRENLAAGDILTSPRYQQMIAQGKRVTLVLIPRGARSSRSAIPEPVWRPLAL